MNTPICSPRTDRGSMPPRSNVSHAVSRSTRCCGSMARASRGEMPKSSASKSVASYRKPPVRAYERSSPERSQPRSSGKSEIPSVPDTTSSHSSSGEETPPGSRQLMATIAIGPSTAAGARGAPAAEACSASAAGASCAASSSARWPVSASMLGWSKTSVAGRGRPVSATRRLRSSTPVRESKPRSAKDVVVSMASGSG